MLLKCCFIFSAFQTPSLVIGKNRGATGSWFVQHTSGGTTRGGYLHTTDSFVNFGGAVDATLTWNNTAADSSVFYLGVSSGVYYLNTTSNTYVAYCWAEIPGFSKFGSYTGNGSADGPVVITGFKPAFIMIKGSSFISNWFIQDNRRNGYNPNSGVALRPNLTNQEDGTTTYDIDILSNGFKLRSSAGDSNTSTATFIYCAWAETPNINLYGAQANAR